MTLSSSINLGIYTMNIKPLTELSKQQKIGVSAFILVAALSLLFLAHHSGAQVEVQDVPTEATQPATGVNYVPSSSQVGAMKVDFQLPSFLGGDKTKPATVAKPVAPTAVQTTVTKPTATPESVVMEGNEQPDNSALIQQENGECVYASNEPKLTQKLLDYFKEKKCRVVHFWQSHHEAKPPVTQVAPVAAAPATTI